MSAGPNNQLGRIITSATARAMAQQNVEMAGKVSEVLTTGIIHYHDTVVVPMNAMLEAVAQQVAYLSLPWYKRAYLTVKSWRRDARPGVGHEEGEGSTAGDRAGDGGSEPGHDGSAAAAPGIEADNAS